ncbi:MAG: hypothetical protein HDS85_01455 [Bacteroidales bacterium]|nr:hypothetical protein [Bacteroidales bacterium]
MKWLFRYILGILLVSLTACTSEELIPGGSGDDMIKIEGDKVYINASMIMPEMAEAGSRALGQTPDYSDMHLYIIEFDNNGSPLRNTLKTVYTPELETPTTGDVRYTAVLNKTDQPRVLHFVVVPKSVEFTFDYEVEAVLIPGLKTEDGRPAFWNRFDFPNGYVSNEPDGSEKLAPELDQIKSVPLLRNFACITMQNEAQDFELKGFSIVNNPTGGTIAPWNASDYLFPDFLDGSDIKTYQEISESYSGIVPSGIEYDNPEAGPTVEENVEPKYLYERPFNSIRHTYIILQGRRAQDTEDSFYKIDLGKNDDQGVFHYYNILRNFKYNIILKSVAARGYANADDAAAGMVFNNLSFDVVLAPMLNISDGKEVVYVNFTNAVITNPDPSTLTFQYRYRNISSSGSGGPLYNNDDVTFIGLEPGEVIDRVEYTTTNDPNGWRSVIIYCKAASVETKTQSFTIVKKSGLGRTVNLILHNKWDFTNVREYPGLIENWNASTPGLGTVSGSVGEDLCIFFDIPDNLSESLFPLVFTLESDKQNLENNPMGLLVVSYGPSGFSGLPGYGTIQGNRIKYLRTITWTDYNDPLVENDPYDNGTAIDNGNGTFTHRIRTRFRTTTDLSDFEFNRSETTVMISNDNFNDAFVSFTRRQ